MKYINTFKTHASYEAELNGGGVDFKIPNVSYCKDVKDIHYNPYNLIEFYVGEITGTTPQTVSIYTNSTNHLDVTVSEGNKWYSYVLPKDKGLSKIEGISIKKVVVKADISFDVFSTFPAQDKHIIPSSTVEASFKSSNTSNINNMFAMFSYCSDLTSLDVSNFDTSNVTNMGGMFGNCSGLTSLDVSSFNTSNVTNMAGMFDRCSGLESLDLRSFNTSNVTNMSNMFLNCSGLASLDLSGWNTSNVTDMTNMFNGCGNLKTITMIGCSLDTVGKIKTQLKADGLREDIVKTE